MAGYWLTFPSAQLFIVIDVYAYHSYHTSYLPRTTTTSSFPCVITTIRLLSLFSFGKDDISKAISAMLPSWAFKFCSFANVWASWKTKTISIMIQISHTHITNRFVAEYNIDIGKCFHHRLLKKLRQEGCTKIHHKKLVALASLLSDFHDRVRTNSEEEPLELKRLRKFS